MSMSINQSITNSRSSTVIVITGLQPSLVTSDKSLFIIELGSKPSIVLSYQKTCQWQSGMQKATTAGCIGICQERSATNKISKTKLRSSTNAEVKARVFINPNPTKADRRSFLDT